MAVSREQVSSKWVLFKQKLHNYLTVITETSRPQPFWHQGLVSWKTTSTGQGGEDGFRMIQARYSQAHLLLCGPVPDRKLSTPDVDRGSRVQKDS